MIPLFPNFKKLTIEDNTQVQNFLNKYLPFSDFNFFSMWSNNIEDDFIASILNENLVIRLRDYITDEPFYSFIGDNKVEDTIENLLRLSINENLQPVLKLVPEINFKLTNSNEFEVQEDRDNFDYIYSSADMSELTGTNFHNQRNFINRFQKLYPEYRVEIIDISKPEVEQAIIGLFQKWGEDKGRLKDEIEHELKATKRAVRDAKFFKLIPLGIFDQDKLVGYMIGDLDHPDYCQTHFAKADTSYIGIFYMLYYHMAKQLVTRGYKYINNEQDLGFPGLRHSKEQWNPIKYLKKYIIKRKSDITQ